ncbi:sensor histidine kinase [Ectobacillus funiculus]|uniref:sensor histidine kinase n=1 Tax=Ectobacillus funiculus TaxID=137993 RepID=UPI00101D69B2|nr:sensor histidine kinase [Ectobacillus funiculus]
MMQNPFKYYRIGSLFFGSFAGLIIILFGIVIWISYHYSVKEMVNKTSYYQESILNGLNKQMAIQARDIEEISLAASRNNGIQKYITGIDDEYTRFRTAMDMTSDLSNLAYSIPIIYSVQMYLDNPPASEMQGPITYSDLQNLQNEKWYTSVIDSDFSWIGQHTITTFRGDISVVSFARKIYDTNGEFKALLVFNIKAADLEALIQGEDQASNRILLDSGGRPIISTGNLSVKEYSQLIEKIGLLSGKVDNQWSMKYTDSFIVWSKPFNSDWLILQITPWNDLTKESRMMATILLSIGIIAIVIALLITLYLSKQFTKPILILTKGMNDYPATFREEQLPSDYHNEFGLLFQGYRRLMNRIEELYRSLEEQHRRQRKAEILALQAMINPHFLYNTLDQVNWMAIEAGQEQISRVLELMGKMFRIGLSNGESVIRIEEELTHLECYMEIQQIRWGEGLTFTTEIPHHIKEYYIPKLTFQPFVENALMHGFHGRSTGSINIAAYEIEDDLLFTVSDNGVGIRADAEMNKKRKTGGYGMRNVRERMESYFGHPYGIEVDSEEGKGTTISIRIPKLREKSI